jgi:hypothetical protein
MAREALQPKKKGWSSRRLKGEGGMGFERRGGDDKPESSLAASELGRPCEVDRSVISP